MKRSERFQGSGFTLLEVMAAVAVLGIVYVTVARSAIQGLQTEGDASRRLRASLIADRVLSDLELELLGGSAPRVGTTEDAEEEFTVLTEVKPFDIASLLEGTTTPGSRGAPATPGMELLKPSLRGGAPTLLSIAVRVAWIEGISEQEVTRQSFAFDLEAAAPLLETIPSPEETKEEADQGTPTGRQQSKTPPALTRPQTTPRPPN